MLEHVKRWIKEIQKTGTVVRPFVLTPGGDTVLACRYLAPIEPPDDIFLEGQPLLYLLAPKKMKYMIDVEFKL